MRRCLTWLAWLTLPTLVAACGTAGAASHGATAKPNRPAAVAGRDTDHDGLTDSAEIRRYHTDPRRRDTDRDGLSDGDEVRRYHTSPRERDSDADGHEDQIELRAGTNPRDPRSRPGFPGADTTGAPARIRLTAYTGPSTISTPNTVISGKTMGCVRVTAPGVVIRNSKISCSESNYAVESGDGDYTGAELRLEDTEIDCRNTNGTAVGEANVTARRLNIHGCENGFDMNQNVTVEDSYIHDLYNGGSAHMDGIQMATGHFVDGHIVSGALDITIRHNTIYAIDPNGEFGTSAIISGHGSDVNILIEKNLLAGGAFTLYCEQDAKGTNYRVADNHFSRTFGSKVGYYGPSTECSDETQSGNVYHETGKPLNLE